MAEANVASMGAWVVSHWISVHTTNTPKKLIFGYLGVSLETLPQQQLSTVTVLAAGSLSEVGRYSFDSTTCSFVYASDLEQTIRSETSEKYKDVWLDFFNEDDVTFSQPFSESHRVFDTELLETPANVTVVLVVTPMSTFSLANGLCTMILSRTREHRRDMLLHMYKLYARKFDKVLWFSESDKPLNIEGSVFTNANKFDKALEKLTQRGSPNTGRICVFAHDLALNTRALENFEKCVANARHFNVHIFFTTGLFRHRTELIPSAPTLIRMNSDIQMFVAYTPRINGNVFCPPWFLDNHAYIFQLNGVYGYTHINSRFPLDPSFVRVPMWFQVNRTSGTDAVLTEVRASNT